MSWQEVRTAARDLVHEVFAANANYFAPGSAVPVPCNVRRHTRTVLQGDLDREGYAQQFEDVDRIVIDTQEVASPARRGRVVMANGDEFWLEVLERVDDGRYQVWNVVGQR